MRITEVPIIFRDRAYGSSKMSNKIVWEATRRCVSLAFTRSASRTVRSVHDKNAAAGSVAAMGEGATDGR
jgi:hypothetical protein